MVGVPFEPELSLKLGSGEGGAPKHGVAKKPMTIFFNGEMRVFDVTEIQARAIIFSAMKQLESKKKSRIQESNSNNKMPQLKNEPNQNVSSISVPVTPQIQPSELSMKQSLQRFLQKRKARMAAASPYAHSEKQLLPLTLS